MTLCNVDFYVDGELYTTKTAIIGQVISQPKPPQKENYIFVGWYIDSVLVYEYDFSTMLVGDLQLHARFVPNAVELTNMLSTQTVKSLVSVNNKLYNTAMGGLLETASSTSQGSGVVVDISGGYCYVLTNYHVIEVNADYEHQAITVEDPWGNEYSAKVYRNPYAPSLAMDESYDLALLYFSYNPTTDIELQEISLAKDPDAGDYVASLGTPGGQKNSITLGRVLSYEKLKGTDGDTEKVTFDIIYHSALIDHGSSGGPLVNTSGELVGLNFAGFESNNYGCAIPLSRINEFMEKYVYAK